MRRLAAGVLAIAGAAFGPAHSEISVVLQDGQTLQATGVRREGEQFLLDLPAGGTIALPASVVASVKLGDDPPPPKTGYDPTDGLTYNEKGKALSGPELKPSKDYPQVISGPEVRAPSVSDQTKAIGRPSTFQADVTRQQEWQPKSDWNMDPDNVNFAPSTWREDIVDSRWEPTSGFDSDKDVLAEGKSTFQKGPINSAWAPTDGFSKVGTSAKVGTGPRPFRNVEARFTAAAGGASSEPAPASRGISAWSCGERIFSRGESVTTGREGELAKSVAVKAVSDSRLTSLPLALYQADGEAGGSTRRAVFSTAGGECRIVGGDMGPLLGVELETEHAIAQSAAAYNAALAASGGPRAKFADKLAYGFSLVTLADPEVSGLREAKLVLVSSSTDLSRIEKSKPAACALSSGQRKKESRKAGMAVKTPRITAGVNGEIATFYTWSGAGGRLYKNAVYVARDGTVSIHRDLVASHVGDHQD